MYVKYLVEVTYKVKRNNFLLEDFNCIPIVKFFLWYLIGVEGNNERVDDQNAIKVLGKKILSKTFDPDYILCCWVRGMPPGMLLLPALLRILFTRTLICIPIEF